MGKADTAGIGPIQYRGYDGTGLSNKGQRAFLGGPVSEARVQSDAGHEDSEAVRPYDAQLALLGFLGQRFLVFDTVCFAAFAEACRDHHGGPGARFSESPDDSRNGIRWRTNYTQIDRMRQASDVRIGLAIPDLLVFGIDRKNISFEPCS
jgi:hypothetical protein